MARIALVTHDYFTRGGTRTMTQFLRDALLRSGAYEPQIISVANSKDDANSVRLRTPRSWRDGVRITHEIDQNVPVIRGGTCGAEFEFMRYRPNRRLTELLSTFDLIQFVAGNPPWACLAEKVTRPVFLWTATTLRADRESRLREAPMGRRIWMEVMTRIAELQEKKALKFVDEVFALSQYSLKAVQRIIGPERGLLAPCGVDTDFYRPESKRDCSYIVCAGRLDDARKNVGLLIRAYQEVCHKVESPPELWLVGPEPTPEILAEIEKSSFRDRVKILGSRPPSELAQIYRRAIFFVLSSDEEGLGIVLLEAMASGLPAISTACGGPETIIVSGDNGLLVHVRDHAGLAGAMIQLIANRPLRERMAKAARETVVQKFSMPAASNVFLKRYGDAVETTLPQARLKTGVIIPTPMAKREPGEA